MRKLKSALPWIALAAAVVAAGLLVAGSFYRKARIVDTGETRAVVEMALNELLARRPEAVEEPGFKTALTSLAGSPHVALVIFSTTEHPIDSFVSGKWMETISTSDQSGALAALGERKRSLFVFGSRSYVRPDPLEGISLEEFSMDQRLLLEVKSVVESGTSDHDDVFGSLIRAVRNPAGDMLGAIGVRYERSSWVGAVPEAAWIVLLLGLALSFGIYWISVPAWTFLDARDHGDKAWVWTAFTLVGNVIALVAYLLARAPRTAKGT
jgi:hypothetical protein